MFEINPQYVNDVTWVSTERNGIPKATRIQKICQELKKIDIQVDFSTEKQRLSKLSELTKDRNACKAHFAELNASNEVAVAEVVKVVVVVVVVVRLLWNKFC